MKIGFLVGVVFTTMLFSGSVFAAEDESWFFDKRLGYNIFVSAFGSESESVIEDVQIVRFEEIAGRKFLVVKSKGFKLNDEEGFIFFESIVAILPDQNFRVRNISNIKHPKYNSN